MNAYSYADGDPVNFSDPYGLYTCVIVQAGPYPCGDPMDPFSGFTDSLFCQNMMQDDDAELESGDSEASDAESASDCSGGGGQSNASPPSSGAASAPPAAAPAQTCNQAAMGALIAFAEDASWIIGGKEILVGAIGAKQIAWRFLYHWMTEASPGTTSGAMGAWAGTQAAHAALAGENPLTWEGWGAFFRDNTPILNTVSKIKNEYNVCMGPAK